MALPVDFPKPPKRPPVAVALSDANGLPTKAWLNYFDALDRFNEAVRARLDTL